MIDITPKKQAILGALAQQYNLGLILLFGSQVTGKTHAESDYDIAYSSSRTLDLDEQGMLINALLPVVERHDERVINLVNIKRATPLLLYAMTSQCQVLYEREPSMFARLRAYAFKQYVETKPLYEEKARRIQMSALR